MVRPPRAPHRGTHEPHRHRRRSGPGRRRSRSRSSPPRDTVEAITAAGGRAIALRADVTDEHAVTAAFDRVRDEFGGVDVGVHCAGRLAPSPIADLDPDVLDAVPPTNLRGTFVVARQAARGRLLRRLLDLRGGHPVPRLRCLRREQGGIEAITLILTRELRGRDITVNTAAPGPTATDPFLDGKTEEQIEAPAKALPLERPGTPADIAHVVAFLTSAEGHWVNGQVLRANGDMA
ncbi:SDR family oxidoreductase [Streptomyces achromogenes]|uniref:SDR family oxidoreductase n=1 Tax=Streptomyces achromogenes TaxID=67255 RepID=UPI0037033717